MDFAKVYITNIWMFFYKGGYELSTPVLRKLCGHAALIILKKIQFLCSFDSLPENLDQVRSLLLFKDVLRTLLRNEGSIN